jgi:hypothetical protein
MEGGSEAEKETEIVTVVLVDMVDSTTTNRRSLWLPGRHLDLAEEMETEIEIENTNPIDQTGIEAPILPRRGHGREMQMRRRGHPLDGALKLVRATISDRRNPAVLKCRSQVAQRV